MDFSSSTQAAHEQTECQINFAELLSILVKIAEYLAAGVQYVVVLDPDPQIALVSSAEQPPRILGPDEELKFPDLLGEFRVVVRRFFE